MAMTEERWKQLRETFDDPNNFEEIDEDGWKSEWYTTGVPGKLGIAADLYNWLECSSTRPSNDMIRKFAEHGYRVHPGERDSFGWLTGVVTDKTTGRNICFG